MKSVNSFAKMDMMMMCMCGMCMTFRAYGPSCNVS